MWLRSTCHQTGYRNASFWPGAVNTLTLHCWLVLNVSHAFLLAGGARRTWPHAHPRVDKEMSCRKAHIAPTAPKSPHERSIISSEEKTKLDTKWSSWHWCNHQEESGDMMTTCDVCLHSSHKLNIRVDKILRVRSISSSWTLCLCTITMFIACFGWQGEYFVGLVILENVHTSMQKTGIVWLSCLTWIQSTWWLITSLMG